MISKRVFDILIVLITLPIWLPIIFVVAVCAWIFHGPPVLFWQVRIGYREREFCLCKFRTMDFIKSDEAGSVCITPLGSWLRRFSLDELPEIWNILRGEMSLVGPRPLLPEYLPYYSPGHRVRHDVLPGLTGMAQINGRNSLEWHEKFDFDCRYVAERSLILDAKILLRTVGVVLTGLGVKDSEGKEARPFKGYH